MTMRITGMNSGLDTESMINELVKASSTKKDNLVKAQTKISWKQDAWKALNSKIYSFFNTKLSNLKYESAFNKKTTTIGDSSLASIVTSDTAANGTQSLAVKQLAKSGYLTGGKLSNDKSVTSKTTLSELAGDSLGDNESFSLRVKSGGEESVINLSGSSKISDVVSALKSAGLNANFDEANQRIFIGASGSGLENDFSVTAVDSSGLKALSAMKLLTKDDLTNPDSATYQEYSYWKSVFEGGDEAMDKAVSEKAAQEAQKLLESLSDMKTKVESLRDARSKLTSDEDKSDNYLAQEKAQKELANTANVLKDYYSAIIDSDTATEAEKEAAQKSLDTVNEALDTASAAADKLGISLPTVAEYNLMSKVRTESEASAETANEIFGVGDSLVSDSAVRVNGQNAIFLLNGAEFESDSNTLSVNGLTITANKVSDSSVDASGNVVYAETTINTTDDVDGIYDMIVDFFKEYNSLIKEMDTLYNAESARDYEPLTSDEKDAMSDTEIEEWEKKIKDALLRRDGDLGTIINTFKTSMLSSYTINGQSYSLSSFGIATLGYFNSGDNEKGVFHIDGYADDEKTSGNTDKLKAMIANDPDTVKSFFTQLIGNLQSQVNKIMQHTEYRSVYNVYDDKLLQKQYDDYTTKIKEQETKLANMEDRYYDQFTAMEKAMAKLNSQQSYISSLFGTSG